jgi:hypothetical protein
MTDSNFLYELYNDDDESKKDDEPREPEEFDDESN